MLYIHAWCEQVTFDIWCACCTHVVCVHVDVCAVYIMCGLHALVCMHDVVLCIMLYDVHVCMVCVDVCAPWDVCTWCVCTICI